MKCCIVVIKQTFSHKENPYLIINENNDCFTDEEEALRIVKENIDENGKFGKRGIAILEKKLNFRVKKAFAKEGNNNQALLKAYEYVTSMKTKAMKRTII